MAKEEEIYIHRPQGSDPKGVTVGGLELGMVHRLASAKAGPYLKKGFTIVDKDGKALPPAQAITTEGGK